jgi:hypothetical protein
MAEQFANNAASTLNGAINNSTTTIVVATGEGSRFPSVGNFRLMIGLDPFTAEIVLATARTGDTITVTRGQEGTTAQSWGNGTSVTHILTAGAINAITFSPGGDLAGTQTSQQVISITGDSGTLNISSTGASIVWNASASAPTLRQANQTASSTNGQLLTIQAQNAVGGTSAGGHISITSGTGTTIPGEVRFNVGSNLSGYFDSNRIFRFGTNPATTASAFATSYPLSSSDIGFGHNSSGSAWFNIFSGGTTTRAAVSAWNTSGGASNTAGISIQGAGSSHATAGYALNGIIEHSGSSNSAIVFSSTDGAGENTQIKGRIWRSGAWSIGDSTQNDTSSEAQAGLTGPLINLTQITGGTLTSTSNQSLLYNNAGTTTLQGHVGHTLIANTTTIASTSTSKFITNVGRRIATNVKTANYTVTTSDEVIIVGTLTGSITITLPTSPTAGDTYTIKDQAGGSATNNIIVSGNGNDIDGAGSYTINTNYESITVVFANGSWSII